MNIDQLAIQLKPYLMYIVWGELILVLVGSLIWLWFRKYRYRVIVIRKRAGSPVWYFDRGYRYTRKSGNETLKLWKSRVTRENPIMFPDSKYINTGTSWINKFVIFLFEDSGRYTPIEPSYAELLMLKPIPHSMEMDRVALKELEKVWHDTRSPMEKAKPFVIGAGILFFIVILIILMSKGQDIWSQITGLFSGK